MRDEGIIMISEVMKSNNTLTQLNLRCKKKKKKKTKEKNHVSVYKCEILLQARKIFFDFLFFKNLC